MRQRKVRSNSSISTMIGTILGFAILLQTAQWSNAVAQCRENVYHENEFLRYAVRWSFLRLGTVEFRQQCGGPEKNAYVLGLSVRSAEGLPFINLRFETRSLHVPHQHGLLHETIATADDTTVYRYDEAAEWYLTEDRQDGIVVRRDTLRHKAPVFDALGLFSIARCFSGGVFDTTLQTLLEHSCHKTDIRSKGRNAMVEVDAFPDEREATEIEGFAHWVGNSYGGMTGTFRGWFTNDEMAIPLKAEFEIFLGSIVLELESFRRSSPDSTLLVHMTGSPKSSIMNGGRP